MGLIVESRSEEKREVVEEFSIVYVKDANICLFLIYFRFKSYLFLILVIV